MGDNPLLYKLNSLNFPDDTVSVEHLDIQLWRPSLYNWKPPGKGWKYMIYTVFHFINVFRNNRYAALIIKLKKSNQIVASLLIVPTYFKWKFMSNHDVQFTYVLVNSKHRGEGLGKLLLNRAIRSLTDFKGDVWYVTTKDNLNSQRLAEKCGFTFYRLGKRSKFKTID
ncbi:GNAT family N-acetyltransferase [Salibacter halophilus]|uniref:GNAT family N-acetyltransferase n=1 Tax=Salibacter halophilus TaxID=1803916 RepID=A0A6N6M6H7_9FLAO|nr:GNAT family N-acetyltransferase [Salibacter halophilus]KAB1063548.1 GNAT family N-acetyltransferase [Salibacter halophilus]